MSNETGGAARPASLARRGAARKSDYRARQDAGTAYARWRECADAIRQLDAVLHWTAELPAGVRGPLRAVRRHLKRHRQYWRTRHRINAARLAASDGGAS